MKLVPDISPSADIDANQEPPHLISAIGPCGDPLQPIPDTSRNTIGKATNSHPDQRSSRLISAIGPTGDALRPIRDAGSHSLGRAVNFNPYHDKRGRFASGDATGGGADAGDGEPKPRSIALHAYASSNLATCAVASMRSIIATKYPDSVPSEESIKAQLAAAAKGILTRPGEKIDWTKNAGIAATPSHYADLVQKVLESNGISTVAKLKYGSMHDLAEAIVSARGQPAMLNLQLDHLGAEHSVAVQWDAEANRFLINNVSTRGDTQRLTREHFESGRITAEVRDSGSILGARALVYEVRTDFPVIIGK